MAKLSDYTGRDTILYATRWTSGEPIPPNLNSITDEDVQGLMEVIHGLKRNRLDLIIHSPGGTLESVEAVVKYLRTKFKNIRAVIPQTAMSAATMMACACDEIVMGKHSSMGPIDPQLLLETAVGPQAIPAQAIIEQFEMAQEQCKDPTLLGSWMPILGQYGPALLVQCQHALDLSEELVSQWLGEYMFKGQRGGRKKAKRIGRWLSDHTKFKSHARHIDREMAKRKGLLITNLEEDQELQDLILSVFHATTHTLTATVATKIIENQLGKAFIKHFQLNPVVLPQQLGAMGPLKPKESVG